MRLTKEALAQTLFILSLSIPAANSESFKNISFHFPSFQMNDQRINFQGNASIVNSHIQLTQGEPLKNPTDAVGRVTYYQPMKLWDISTGNVADFVSRFTFAIDSHKNHSRAEGMVFFLAPNGSQIPEHSGHFLGLTNSNANTTNTSAFVAVEFDTFHKDLTNVWDPPCDHIGIDVKNLTSVNATCVSWMDYSIFHGKKFHATITYNARAMSLSVLFGDNADNSTSLCYQPLNLTEYLQRFGWYGYKLKRNRNGQSGEEEDFRGIGEGLGQSKGPKKYSYKVLAGATTNFSNSRLLGEGGFGGVYEGHLDDINSHVAIKKITPESNQGVKEYATEVKTIRHLRHKNLVELVGWCHERSKFLLVYEYMSNGSLDSHLFKDKVLLTWERRYNIAKGIALGLKYLHEDLKHCIVHRDIKSSNVLLDTHFEAKLGDFGLARIVDHAKGSQTTVLAGTLEYLPLKVSSQTNDEIFVIADHLQG
ncbi:L-type lectin-domain containing receptor kinase IX.1-like [Eucalyptus grandis]|uniref:L-type lectin-domain containing receptor kinase IX.1-like n=1 Tax=Eucalyptus grandis TaxID=71139 RepID=UPI00192ED81D|nr:L-type lectin-domain containing receptor kinase IX.1-like [Eucalyptus grandis]